MLHFNPPKLYFTYILFFMNLYLLLYDIAAFYISLPYIRSKQIICHLASTDKHYLPVRSISKHKWREYLTQQLDYLNYY